MLHSRSKLTVFKQQFMIIHDTAYNSIHIEINAL